jgi:hypothetical protein
MILQIAIASLIPIYFLSWGTGCVEGIMFKRYLRKNHPQLADVHYPGLLRGSIYQQLKTIAWLWKREYVAVGDTGLIRRADIHRSINLVAVGLMLMSIIGLLIGGPRVFSNDKNETKEAEQVGSSNGG